MIDSDDVAIWSICILFIISGFLLTVIFVVGCAFIIEWLFDLLNINIDKMLYWTGVGLIILIATFCKPSSKKE